MGKIANQIKEKLQVALQPSLLELTDFSARHAGHSPQAAAGESHFNLRIAAHQLNGLSRIEQHRLIHALLKEELTGDIHALTIQIVSD